MIRALRFFAFTMNGIGTIIGSAAVVFVLVALGTRRTIRRLELAAARDRQSLE